jgi:hypothetical protein
LAVAPEGSGLLQTGPDKMRPVMKRAPARRGKVKPAEKPARKPAAPRPPRARHNVYVIELDGRVLNHARFRAANPERDITKPCVYIGCTGLSPEKRFARHKAGIQANSYVQRYGLRLLPALYAYANPMPYDAARDMEVELAIALQEQGYAVWQA